MSIGSEHDMIINVWKWKVNLKYASNKISSKIKAIAFFFNGNFITVGNRHVKFWYLQTSRSVSVSYIINIFQIQNRNIQNTN